jgi:hypothetical protein
MPQQRRCEWSDLSLLLNGSTRDQYRELACGERGGFERRFWWLADPFYALPGNERRSEHYYRIVLNEMLEESASPRRMRWSRDNTELLLRFGAAIGWERVRASGSISAAEVSLVGHHRKGGRQFLPPPEYFNDPTIISDGDWELDPERSRSRYALPQFVHYAPIDYQIATFRRGDSAVVVVRGGWRHPGEPQDTLRTALALVKDEFTEPVIAIERDGNALSAVVAREPMLASIELWNTRDTVAGRERSWLDLAERLPDGFGVWDILLLEGPDALPESLNLAIPLSRQSDVFSPAERIGLFWEIYGVGEDPEMLDFTLTVARLGRSFLRRAAEWAGILGRREDTVRLRWSEQVFGARSIAPQSIGVQLEGSMSGEYVLTLSARRSTGEEATVEKHLTVR